MGPKKRLPSHAYTVGLIYVKPLEMNAITVMLDEEYESVPLALGDMNEYILGRIGKHNVAIVGPGRGAQGKVAIASVVGSIHWTFRNMTIGLLVGIGGGVPHLPKQDVRLGDVVIGAPEVGPAVVQYDLGKETSTGFEVTRTLNKPPALLLQVVNAVEDKYLRQEPGEEGFFTTHLRRFDKFPRLRERYKRPSAPDRLFRVDYRHIEGSDCSQHDEQFEVRRAVRNPRDEVQMHYSTILSGDRVMKSEVMRDKVSGQFHNALCFEMEAAGLMDVFACLVVRGICDYSDSHKNKVWQEYAAATAAAYARELLLTMAQRVVQGLERVEHSLYNERDNSPISQAIRAPTTTINQQEHPPGHANDSRGPIDESAAYSLEKMSLLHRAAMMGVDDLVKELLDSGHDPNLKTDDGFVPLHLTALSDHAEAARLLLAAGADINACGGHRVTPLSLATQQHSINVVKVLLQHSPEVDLANNGGQTPLFAAAVNGFVEIFKMLLDEGANVHLQQLKQKWTVLHLSIINGQTEVVKEILRRYPCEKQLLEAESETGVRPLLAACASGQQEIAKLLLDAGCDIDAKDQNGLTALRQAVQNSDLDITRLLLERGARTDIPSVHGISLVDTSRLLQNSGMRDLLIAHGAS